MGSYNTQYQSYYSTLTKESHRGPYGRRPASTKATRIFSKEFFIRRLYQELIVVMCLMFIVVICKTIKTPETTALYTYFKGMVSYSYNYNTLYENIKNINVTDVSNDIQEYIDKFKAGITGEQTLKEKILTEFIAPIRGKITSSYGERKDPLTNEGVFHYGVDINIQEGTKVQCSSDGVVEFIGEDEKLGKYILIDHGMGVETKYAHLKEVNVEQGSSIKKLDIIALSGNSGKSTGPHLHFELLYMGDNKNPQEYINFADVP